MDIDHTVTVLIGDQYINIKCLSPITYSELMEKEFKLDSIRKNNPRTWRTKIWKYNNKLSNTRRTINEQLIINSKILTSHNIGSLEKTTKTRLKYGIEERKE